MQEHPVPQNITTYQFRLIGNMTIKQFLLLLAGAGGALIAYSTNLPGILKWPFLISSILLGVALAFVPYEERMLDQWFVVFLRAIYRPTKYYWRRTPRPPAFFEYAQRGTTLAIPEDTSPQRQQRVQSFLSSLPQGKTDAEDDPLDVFRGGQQIAALFSDTPAAAGVVPGGRLASKPPLVEHPHRLHTQAPAVVAPTSVVAPPPQPTHVSPSPASEAPPFVTVDGAEEEVDEAVAQSHPHSVGTVGVDVLPSVPSAHSAPATMEPPPSATPELTSNYVAAQISADSGNTTPAVFNRDLPFPSTPTTPNIVFGMVRTHDGAIVANAILEILDAQGQTVRAMKTNNLGQFFISSPLPDGDFILETEKAGYRFPRYKLTLSGAVLDPIDILPE